MMRESGTVVYLRAALDQLVERTRRDTARPLLATGDRRATLATLLEERDPLYREVAHLVVESGTPSAGSLAGRIARGPGHAGAQPRGRAEMSPRTLTVGLGERSYPIHIGPGLIGQPALFSPHLKSGRAAVITNETVAPLYADAVERTLAACGTRFFRVVIPDGEAEKRWETLDRVYGELLRAQADRKTVIVALGGGVVGDLAGFAAATYQRGVPFIQVPTTLLAQVDSSVGGKTGVNHPLGKNMIGAFHQPLAVIADTATLDTLPDRELAAGLAEVIKYGAIRDLPFLDWLEANVDRLRARDPAALAYAIGRSCEVKAEIVALDEREAGVRALLNLGHTFGHAIETLEGYGTWLHGEAVAAGMVMAARLSARLRRLAARRCESPRGAGPSRRPPGRAAEARGRRLARRHGARQEERVRPHHAHPARPPGRGRHRKGCAGRRARGVPLRSLAPSARAPAAPGRPSFPGRPACLPSIPPRRSRAGRPRPPRGGPPPRAPFRAASTPPNSPGRAPAPREGASPPAPGRRP